MKTMHLVFVCALLAICQLLTAQSLPYQFAFWKEQFTPLNDATVMPQMAWEDGLVPVQLGFPFKLGEKTFETLQIGPALGGLSDNFYLINGDTLQGIFGYYTLVDLAVQPGTKISYKLDGTAPNRIFKVEWLKVGFDGESGEISFQIWLHETTNIIQIKLGSQNVPVPENVFLNGKSPLCGLGLNEFLNENGSVEIDYAHWITGSAAAPADTILYNLIANNPGDTGFGCDGIPEEGAVFTFTPGNVSSVHTPPIVQSMQFYPVPATEKINFFRPESSDALIQILDMQGRLLYSSILSAGAESLQLPAQLAPGTYLLRRIVDGKTSAGKLIIG